MRRRLAVILSGTALAVLGLFACGDDDDGGAKAKDAGTPETSAPDTSMGDSSRPDTSMPVDSGTDAAVVPQTVVSFNATTGENPDGIAQLPAGMGGLVVSLAKNGKIVSILGDGGTQEYANMGFTGVNQTGAVGAVWLLGITNDVAGNLYAAVQTQGPPLSAGPPPSWTPEPGVYKIPAGGGTPVLFASHPAMKAAKTLMLIGTDLYISDTGGKIFKADTTGATPQVASIWSADPELAGDLNACPVPIPVAVGVAGLAHDANNIYAVNIDKGSLLKIPLDPDGGVAGTPVVIKKDCTTLGGADGLLLDKDGSFLVGVAVKNIVQRVTAAGAVTPFLSGKPLDGPTKMFIDTSGGKRTLLILSPAFGSSAANPAAAKPSVVSYELAP